MKKLVNIMTCLVSFYLAPTMGYAENEKCDVTINCNTIGYEITNGFYYDGTPSEQIRLVCYPSATGKNNCTFYNLKNICNSKNPDETMKDLFKKYVILKESKDIKKCNPSFVKERKLND